MMELGHWEIDSNLLVESINPIDFFGFVYKITRLDTGRIYIGRKQLIFTRRIKVSGRKNRKHVKKESDWKTYTGSCKELNQEISTLGKDKFEFKILKCCKTKRELGYLETKIQFENDVLTSRFDNGLRKYYNSNIMNRWFADEKKE